MDNLKKIDRLFYRGLRICLNFNFQMSIDELCTECKIVPLNIRRNIHLLLFMHKLKDCDMLLKKPNIVTRLHQAPVFGYYKPNNERVRQNVFYRGGLAWNSLQANERNLAFSDFKQQQQKGTT